MFRPIQIARSSIGGSLDGITHLQLFTLITNATTFWVAIGLNYSNLTWYYDSTIACVDGIICILNLMRTLTNRILLGVT